VGTPQECLANLRRRLRLEPQHPWERYADLIREAGGLYDCSPRGFTVHLGDEIREILPVGGLTEEHYHYLAPVLEDDWHRALLAKGVLQRMLAQSAGEGGDVYYVSWDIAWRALKDKYGKWEDEWLPMLVEKAGFAATEEAVREAIEEYRKNTPPPRSSRSTPRWDRDAGVLSFGDRSWRFRHQDGPTRGLLDALEDVSWQRPVQLRELDPDQVHEAAKYLRSRTRPFLNWHAPNDGTLFWSRP
jgi:hypothetical protein